MILMECFCLYMSVRSTFNNCSASLQSHYKKNPDSTNSHVSTCITLIIYVFGMYFYFIIYLFMGKFLYTSDIISSLENIALTAYHIRMFGKQFMAIWGRDGIFQVDIRVVTTCPGRFYGCSRKQKNYKLHTASSDRTTLPNFNLTEEASW